MTAGEPRTVRVKIAVCIDSEGRYAAYGISRDDQYGNAENAQEDLDNISHDHLRHFRFLEVDLPVPDDNPVTVDTIEPKAPTPTLTIIDPEDA